MLHLVTPLLVAQLAAPALPADAPAAAINEAARTMLLDRAWLQSDPGFANAGDVHVVSHRNGARVVVRATPIVDGVDVEGADRVLVVDGGSIKRDTRAAALAKVNAFALDDHIAIALACDAVKGCLFRDPTVEDLRGFAVQRWKATVDQKGIRATWRVRIPTLDPRDMKDVWIDAETGDVVRTQPSIQFAAPTKANVFVNDQPKPGDALTSDLHVDDLTELDDLPIGSHLRGDHFETFNCCKHYTCKDASTTCLTNLQQQQEAGQTPTQQPQDVADCAEASDTGAITSNLDVAVPTADLPFQIPGFTGNTIFAQVAFCAELPRVVSKAGAGPNGEDGWFETPVDVAGDAATSPDVAATEEDAFAEVEVYHSISVFFQHVRDVLGNPAFCLGPNSMTCDADGTSTKDQTTGLPVHAFHVTTNVLFPALNLQDLGVQIFQGKGKTADNPIVIQNFQRVPNAAFIPALSGGPINIPPELAPLAQIFVRPFDSNVFFQGDKDFAYDGDVVHHEFTHGVVHAFVPNLAVNGVDDYGTHVEPGALNEGWADYMSSSFAGNSQVGEYASQGLAPAGETGLRDNDNQKKCPDDLIGEVHGDSEPWAGVLWATRQSLNGDTTKIAAFDKAVLAAIQNAADDETFATAGQHLVDAVKADATLGQTVADFAQQQLDTRALSNCVRVWPLADLNADESDIVVKKVPQLFQPAVTDNGLKSFAPALFQLRVKVPAKSGGFTIKWDQSAGGLGFSNGTANIGVLVHETANDTDRLHWTYAADGTPSATDDAGAAVAFDPNSATTKATVGAADSTGVSKATFTQTLDSTCDARTFIVDILSLDQAATLANIDVTNNATQLDCTPKPPPGGDKKPAPAGCGCSSSADSVPVVALCGVLALVVRRRRRR